MRSFDSRMMLIKQDILQGELNKAISMALKMLKQIAKENGLELVTE